MITDFVYENTGFTLTAGGLNNMEWLGFWKQYLAVAISFTGISLVYISSNKDREKQLQEKNAQQYLEDVLHRSYLDEFCISSRCPWEF